MKIKVMTICLLIIYIVSGCGYYGLAPSEDSSSNSADLNYDYIELSDNYLVTYKDVPKDAYYFKHVALVSDLGIMTGKNKNYFGVLEEADYISVLISMINLHCKLNGTTFKYVSNDNDNWYEPFVDYAIKNKIIGNESDDVYRKVTRGEFAELLVAAVPCSILNEINSVLDNSIPDVDMNHQYSKSIYTLYRAGIFTGIDDERNFKPDENIVRRDMAIAIAVTLVDNMRGNVTLDKENLSSSDMIPKLQNEALSDDYFKTSAFLGNSHVEGMKSYTNLSNASFYSQVGATVFSISDKQLVNMLQNQYDSFYIELGINEIGYGTSAVIEKYNEIIDRIKSKNPKSKIYVMSVLPVTAEKAYTNSVFSKDKIQDLNNAIYQMCVNQNCYYLDIYTLLADSNGYLPSENSPDGIHITKSSYDKWEAYIRTHYVKSTS